MTQYWHLPLQVRTSVSYAGNLKHRKTLSDIEILFMEDNVQMSSLPNKTARKDNLTSHQRVPTSELPKKQKPEQKTESI